MCAFVVGEFVNCVHAQKVREYYIMSLEFVWKVQLSRTLCVCERGEGGERGSNPCFNFGDGLKRGQCRQRFSKQNKF